MDEMTLNVRTAAVRVDGLSRRYGATRALDEVDLTLERGITGLLGPNGAGKTTLLSILATVGEPDAGRVSVFGLDPRAAAERVEIRRRLGYLPQELGYHRHFTVAGFLDYVAILKEITDRRRRAEEVARVLAAIGLEARARTRIRVLSGGMRQRLGIAQALLGRPDLLILDEPTAGLDPEQRLRFRELLSDLPGDPVIVLSTHQADDIAAICPRSSCCSRAGGSQVTVRSGAPRLRTVLGLATVEARMLFRSLLVLAGLLAGGLVIWALIHSVQPLWWNVAWQIGYGQAVLGMAVLIAAHLAAGRARRDGMADLYASFPATAATRTLGQLTGLAGTLPASLLLIGGTAAAVQVLGPVGVPGIAALAGGLLLVIAAGAAGIAICTRFPHPLAGVLAGVALFVPVVESNNLNGGSGHRRMGSPPRPRNQQQQPH
jgi:ABC-2 type transport system ATP-binding protein